MSAHTPDDGRDGDRADELAGLYRAAAHETPPPALDAKILAAARHAGASPARRPSRRWLVPVSVAATVLLGVGAVLRLSEQGALEPEESLPATLSAGPPEARAPAAAETFARERRAETSADTAAGMRQHGASVGGAHVVSVEVRGEPGAYEFRVGIRSADAGCGRYADWWEVVSEDGRLLYRRVLLHSHVEEQPFVRSGGPVPIDATTVVWVRAHMSDGGYGGTAFKGSVEKGFARAPLAPGFAAGLARQAPLPEGCAF